MTLFNLLYDIIIYLYALSLLFYFSDCIRRNPRAKRLGTGFLILVFVIQIVSITIRTIEERTLPLFSTYDFFFVLTFILILISFFIEKVLKTDYAVLLLNVIGFCAMVQNRLHSPGEGVLPTGWDTVHGLLILHVIFANISFAAYTVAAVFGSMYLFLHRKLKQKKWDNTVRRLPSLESMEKYTYTAMLIGTPVLIVSLIVALMSIVAEGRYILLLDSKVVFTLLALCVYVAFFATKKMRNYSANTMAIWAILGYILFILNFVSNSWSAFHQWVGV
ncbi:cytochrome c biogenesis protein CcsA [Paenibacillus sp. PK4536]|uniref:Protein HemX n=1 Tax=Paenibacillus nuruki TaxID=1886670 RepID=A0A1E3L9L3_9BACL|nr:MULTISPECIES: cytochrome c biogenesis protein CcsA [Paenibacillus]ODP30522.1 Protein HemX [Paenibacillus nuruki]TKJ90123.1 ABC transporter permease [Paenibacillus sp. CFBP13512]WIM39371.1 cytochrome c biogenesis protein CcsA [Paenibacillus sp. PK4536]CAJ1313915.1 Protein HemX [Paenibacillus nuruki]